MQHFTLFSDVLCKLTTLSSYNWAFNKMQVLKLLGDRLTDEAEVTQVLDGNTRRVKRRRV